MSLAMAQIFLGHIEVFEGARIRGRCPIGSQTCCRSSWRIFCTVQRTATWWSIELAWIGKFPPCEQGVRSALPMQGTSARLTPRQTHTELASKIIKSGGDYVLALKGSRNKVQEDADGWFIDPILARLSQPYKTVDIGHDRIEKRTTRATG
jgi:hypothetical protein